MTFTTYDCCRYGVLIGTRFRYDKVRLMKVRVMKSRFVLHYASLSSYMDGDFIPYFNFICQIVGSAHSVNL